MTVTLKLATSLDGRIATAGRESRWITGEAARAQVHRLRAEHDAVVIGIETALADDPELTVRLEGAATRPARIVLDSHQRLPLDSKLVRTARESPTVVVTIDVPSPTLGRAGVRILRVPAAGERPELKATVNALADLGLSRLLVEGGGQVAASFIRCGLVDRIEWFRAPILLGAEGRPCLGALALTALADAPRFQRMAIETLGEDLWERYALTPRPVTGEGGAHEGATLPMWEGEGRDLLGDRSPPASPLWPAARVTLLPRTGEG